MGRRCETNGAEPGWSGKAAQGYVTIRHRARPSPYYERLVNFLSTLHQKIRTSLPQPLTPVTEDTQTSGSVPFRTQFRTLFNDFMGNH
jgi:hypothetical protein